MTTALSSTEVSALRQDAKVCGIVLTLEVARKLLRLVQDRPLCLDALLMEPRPEWLTKIVGER